MEQTASEVATRWMKAVTFGDVDTALALSSSSIVYTTGQVRRYVGHQGILDIIADFNRLEGFMEIETEGEILESDGVVALRRIERYTLPGGGVEIRGCSFVEVESGQVTRWADYKSMATLDAVAG